uniref:NADH-ubiquinone oxidoreductase chain 4L n=1 Tax=Allonychiurus kimi TaxID=2779777 RepID=A0A7M3UYU4_9HEXA|nr:NADH dehydrogenase subunit 4L [Allonychiurus kimi]QOL12121.1 NADH dehydrogenase subunit 4L [Allonychiurus kimi]
MNVISGLIIMSGLWMFCSKRKHLLLTLLSLEYMVLGIFLMFFMMMKMGMIYYSLFYLVFSACEGALGLSILVTMSRTHGGDSFNLFNLNYDKIYFFINFIFMI